MISGHSYLPNDRDFGHIELAWKSNSIYVPDDWEKVVTGAHHKNPFKVRKMERGDFVSLKDLKKAIVNRKVSTNGGKVEWLKIQWVSMSKDKPLQFQYRYSHNTLEVWKTVNLKRKTKGRPQTLVDLYCHHCTQFPGQINKKLDLLELLQFVPPIYHSFYTNLDGSAEVSNSECDTNSDED